MGDSRNRIQYLKLTFKFLKQKSKTTTFHFQDVFRLFYVAIRLSSLTVERMIYSQT